jgi:hypothetical protein
MSDHVQISPVASSCASGTSMHENARECTVSAEIAPHPAQLNNPCPERAQQVQGPTRALSQKHRTALDMLASGKSDYEICFVLKIDASTLYRWKHNNPLFIAELNRRHQELWSDIAANLRLVVARAIATIDRQLLSADDVDSHRAARTLLNLVNTDRLSPKNAPTRVDDVLDTFLRNQQPKPAPKSDEQAHNFSDAQRQALLDQIFAEEAQAEADCQAAAAQRSALYHQRRAKSKSKTDNPTTQSPTPEES